MGQGNNGQALPSSEYSLIRDLPNGSIVRESSNGRFHFLKEYSFTNQQAYQQAFVNFSKKLPEKHQHILFLERTNTKLENTFCSTFYKISLLYEYLEHNLQKEIQQRIQEKKVFDEKEVWSVLCSCTLAVNEMIRFEGRSHAALKTKDIRLTTEGVVKILSLEMVGMDSDHDLNEEGTPKQLALTILNCLLMDEITNDSQEYLLDLVDSLDSTMEMKNILRLMLNSNTKFLELEEYLFKLVQEETDSLNSYSNTPLLRQKATKETNSYSRIPEQSKQDDSLMSMNKDSQDFTQNSSSEPLTDEYQTPDENDVMDDSKSKVSDSQNNTLREKNSTPSPEKPKLDSSHSNFMLSKRNQSNGSNDFQQSNFENTQKSLFTDPKLLKLIHTDLEDIKKRKSIAGSRKIGPSESTSNLESKGNQFAPSNTSSSINLGLNSVITVNAATTENSNRKPVQNASNSNSMTNLTIKEIDNSNASSHARISSKKQSERSISFDREEHIAKTITNMAVKNERTESLDAGWKNQKEVQEYRSNPEEKKMQERQERRYDNIMENEEMGFKKNKVVKPREEIKESREPPRELKEVKQFKQNKEDMATLYNPANSNVNTIVYNSSSSYNSSSFPLSNIYTNTGNALERSKVQTKQLYYQQPKPQLEYVNETYIRGRYEGTKLNNVRHGKGVFYYNEGGKYIGEWKENKMHGKGTLYYPNNSIAYEGDWQEDQLWGKGILYNEEVSPLKKPFNYKDFEAVDEYWIKYEGQFEADSKNGEGKLYLSNEQIFEGRFKDDMVHGEGFLLRRDGSKIRGIWDENKLVKHLY